MITILVVDDTYFMQRLTARVLEKEGHLVITALNGLEAIALLAARPVDLMITDLQMPEMDGLALVRHLRADGRYGTLPIVMLTGSGQPRDIAAAQEAGVDLCLDKPASSREILQAVGHALALHAPA